MRKTSFLLLMTLVSCTASLESRLDRICRPLFPEGEPGAAVLVMQGDSILFDKGYGLARLDQPDDGALREIGFSESLPKNNFPQNSHITGDTPFNIASVSKQFTAVAVLQLAAQGKLSLEDPVGLYFPEFKAPFWQEVKIKHLLSHSSGIPDARGYLTRQQKIDGDDTLAVEYLNTLEELHFAPGRAYEYMNPTFVLCGFLIERITGEPFVDYMQEHVFGPAGMQHTVYFDRNNPDPQAAHGYVELDELPRHWIEYDFGEETFFATRPDGGIYTSTHDFVLWEKALRQGTVLPQEWLQDAFSPHILVTGSPWSDYQNRPNTWYGYGWFLEPKTESTPLRIYHTGDNGGFMILAARYPEQDLLILVFANRSDWDRYGLFMQLEKEIISYSGRR